MIDKQRLRTLLLGGAIGALAGVLLAPRSGRELRSNLANRAGEAREKSRETYFETQERLQERLAETREGPYVSPAGEPEVSLGPERLPEEPDAYTERPRLREVSSEAYREEHSDARPDELRRKVQETRARLRERLDDPEQGGVKEDPNE
ncbi:MAG: YtxH domain-containing protein [Rubrobacteraceae bacterium]